MKVDRVILSTNDNPLYIEFWPLIANAWNNMRVKPTLALIGDENIRIDESLGDVIRFKPIPGIPTGFQAQVIRLLLPIYFEEEVCLISDIDMLPLNKELLLDVIADIPNDKFVVYNNKLYDCLKNISIYPMCYNAAKGKTFKEVFKINDPQQIPQLIKLWYNFSSNLNIDNSFQDKEWAKKIIWLTDERMLAEYLHSWNNYESRCLKLDYTFDRLIDRSNWQYDVNLAKNNFYREAHLPRPYRNFENKKKIDQLLIDANLEHLIYSRKKL